MYVSQRVEFTSALNSLQSSDAKPSSLLVSISEPSLVLD